MCENVPSVVVVGQYQIEICCLRVKSNNIAVGAHRGPIAWSIGFRAVAVHADAHREFPLNISHEDIIRGIKVILDEVGGVRAEGDEAPVTADRGFVARTSDCLTSTRGQIDTLGQMSFSIVQEDVRHVVRVA